VKKVLFVCTANICRSPMAATIFNTLTEDRSLSFPAEKNQ
jgi:protein-tyrosine phosphatase